MALPSSTEHNEGLSLLIVKQFGFFLSNTTPDVLYQLSDCKCTILNLITIMELKVWSTSETRNINSHV